jgi:hypothetical protein
MRPVVACDGDGAALLDRRLLLSVAVAPGPHATHHAGRIHSPVHPAVHVNKTPAASRRVTPAQQINKLYAQFLTNLQTVEVSYVQSLTQQSSTTIPVSTTLTAPYQAGSATMQVQDPAVFGPMSSSAPVTASAQVGGAVVGTFSLIGSSGNQLAIDNTQSSQVSLGQNTVLSAQISQSASSSAGSIFPSYIIASTQQLAVRLVSYFNSLPFKLPRMYAPPHQSQRAGAIQQFVYQAVAGTAPTSLQQSLLGVTLPQTPGSDLQIYDAVIATVVNGSRLQLLGNVQQIFAGKLPIIPINSSGGSGSSSTGGTGSTSGGATTGSASTGSASTGTA